MRIDSYVSERRKKRKKRYTYFLAIAAFLLVYFIALGIFVLIVRSPAFQAEKITIQGNSAVSNAQIMQLLQANIIRKNDLPNGANSGFKAMLGFNNMLIWPDALSTTTVAMIPQLQSVTMAKNYFLHTITVTVVERQPFAIWCLDANDDTAADTTAAPEDDVAASASSTTSDVSSNVNENCFWFDETGTVFATALDTQGGAIFVVHDTTQSKLNFNQQVLPDAFLQNLLSVLNVLKESGIAVANITIPDISLEQVNVTTPRGPILYFSLQFPSDTDLPVLQNLMTLPNFNNLQYIDFTVQNRAFYK